MSELTIVGNTPVKNLLTILLPYLKIKKPIANLVLKIIDNSLQIKDRNHFLEVCKLVDEVAEHTESRKRKITTEYVENYYKNNSFLN